MYTFYCRIFLLVGTCIVIFVLLQVLVRSLHVTTVSVCPTAVGVIRCQIVQTTPMRNTAVSSVKAFLFNQ